MRRADEVLSSVGSVSNLHYTPGWGALGTVTVAAIAVLVNIWTNRKALRASAQALSSSTAQFRQQREDTRADKLRIEVIGLVNALAQRRIRLYVAINRIDEAVGKIGRSDDLASDLIRVDRSMRAIMATEYWEYTNDAARTPSRFACSPPTTKSLDTSTRFNSLSRVSENITNLL